jgi:2-iminoacetate synthase ThiH
MKLQKASGFMSFIPWSLNQIIKMQEDGMIKYPLGLELLKMIAISKLFFRSHRSSQSSWLANGIGMAQLALTYGADDFGGTLIGESS